MPKNLQLFIVRFFHDAFLVGVAGVILNDKNEVLLFRHTYRHVPWGLPSGYIKAGEHPQEGLEREIKEESGFVVLVESPVKIRTDRETARLEVCYGGIFCGGEFSKSDEVAEAKFFAFDELPLLRKDQLLLIASVLEKKKVQQRHFISLQVR